MPYSKTRFFIDPPPVRRTPPVTVMSNFHEEGVFFLQKMPTNEQLESSVIGRRCNLILMDSIESLHSWIKKAPSGLEEKCTPLTLVNARRIHTKNLIGVVFEEGLKQRPVKNARDGYARRINKKWKKLGLKFKTPKTSKMQLMIGSSTLDRVTRVIKDAEDSSGRPAVAVIEPLRSGQLPWHFARSLRAYPL